MRRKLICWILALVLVISCAPTALAADAPQPRQREGLPLERNWHETDDEGGMTTQSAEGYEDWRDQWRSDWFGKDDATYMTDGDWKYYINDDGTATLTAYLGHNINIATPVTVGGKAVTIIGTGAFDCMEKLASITISEGVKQLGDIESEDGEGGTYLVGQVFSCCSELASISLPSTLETLGQSNFAYCFSLSTITISSSNTFFRMSDGVLFSGASGVNECLEFYPCTKTNTTYAVPAGVVRIAEYAIQNNLYLKEMTIPGSVKESYRGVDALPELTTLNVEEGTTAISGFGFCYNLSTVNLPSTLVTIGDGAFISCENLTSITLPEGLLHIGSDAFQESGLTSINIPATVEQIKFPAFTGCPDLSVITVTAGSAYYRSTDNVLFSQDGKSLLLYPSGKSGDSYTIPEGVETIGWGAFRSVIPTQILLPESLLCIDMWAFSACQITSVNLPKNVNEVNMFAFDACYALKSINVNNDNSSFKSEDDVLFTKDGTQLVTYPLGKSAANYTVPEGVTKICWGAFFEADITNVTLPSTLTEIDGEAFKFSMLSSVIIPDSVNTIGDGAFAESPISSVVIPAAVTSIGHDAFMRCEKLTSFDVAPANTAYKSIDGVLFTKDGKILLQFPQSKGASGLSSLKATAVKSYTVPDGVETISSSAFQGTGLQQVSLPQSLVSIKSSSFTTCDLSSMIIPHNVAEIDSFAFANNPNLRKVIVYNDSIDYASAQMMFESVFIGSPNVVLCGHTGSATQAYAQRYGLPFKIIPSSVSLNTALATLFIGAADKLSAATSPAGAEVTWSSSNPSVVSVDSGGNIKANAVGTAAITATSFDKSASCTINVINPIPVGLSCTKTDATIYGAANGSVTITASGGNSGSYEYSLDNGASWQAANTFGSLGANSYIAAVRDAAFPTNTAATVVKVGQPTYMGSVPAAKIASKVNAGTAVTIVPPAPPKGYTAQSTTYTSSNPAIATVDANGNVSFIVGGKVTIITKVVSQTVDKKGRLKTKITTVKKTITVQQPIASISLNLGSTTLARTQKVKLTAAIAPATASNKKLTWKSSNPKIAAVSSAGVVTGKAGGTAVVTCTAKDGSGVIASCTVTVTPIYPTAIKMSKTALTVKLGKTAALKATITPKNTDFKTITWVSSNPAVATVDAKGKIRGISAGSAVITAATSSGQIAACTVTVQ